MTDIKCALQEGVRLLNQHSQSARIDAEALLTHTLNVSRTYFYTHPEQLLTPKQTELFQGLIRQRAAGIPIAHLTNFREFWSMPLRITPTTLIPRPETELLVEIVLAMVGKQPGASILDLGTGSGAIAIALASERPDWHLFACDISEAAVQVARENVVHNGLSNIQISQSDWFKSVPEGLFTAIVSNPPYLAATDPHLQQGDLRFEPPGALVSGSDGLVALTHIIKEGYSHLVPGGLLLLEHGYTQGAAVAQLFQQHGYQSIQCWQDLQGHDRVSGGWRAKKGDSEKLCNPFLMSYS